MIKAKVSQEKSLMLEKKKLKTVPKWLRGTRIYPGALSDFWGFSCGETWVVKGVKVKMSHVICFTGKITWFQYISTVHMGHQLPLKPACLHEWAHTWVNTELYNRSAVDGSSWPTGGGRVNSFTRKILISPSLIHLPQTTTRVFFYEKK